MKADGESSNLFPMSLSSMEAFHLFDTSDCFPNQIYGRLRCDGQLDRTAAEQAVQLVMDRQPMLNVAIMRDNSRLTWQRQAGQSAPIRWHHESSQGIRLDPIDIDNEHPWRVNFLTSVTGDSRTTRSEIWFQASHTVFDGLGATQLIGDWLKMYHQLTGDGKPARLHRLNSDSLRDRNRLGLLEKSYLRNIWKQPIGLFGATKFVFRKPAQFCDSSAAQVWDYQSQPNVIGTWLDESVSADLKQKSLELSVNVNTLLVGELMKTLETECRKNLNRQSPWVRIILPMSIRTIADRRLPAANRATVVQVDRSAGDFERADFIQSLDREIGIIRKWELGKLFLLAVRGMSMFPGMLRHAAANQKCRGTAIFANLGEPFGRLGLPVIDQKIVVGNLQLTEFDFVGPIRHGTPVNFTVQKHHGRHRVSLHFDSRVVSADEADKLIQQYTTAIVSLTRK